MRDQLLPLAVSETEFEAWRTARQARRRKDMPTPAFVDLDGFAANDTKRLKTDLAHVVGAPLDMDAFEADLALVAGLDRYETVTWNLVRDPARGYGLAVHGKAKSYAPPFMMLGINLENTTSSEFRITATGRYLAFDVLGSGSELRIDGTVGSDPTAAAELYRPLGRTALFVAPYAAAGQQTFNVIDDNENVVARYRQGTSRAGINLGVNLGARSDLRLGTYIGRSTTTIKIGDPGFPELRGKETGTELVWRVDTQDSPVVPSGGVLSTVRLARINSSPDVEFQGDKFQFATEVTQLSGTGDHFWSYGPRSRLFVYGGAGISFDGTPLPTSLFALGTPFRRGAYNAGELNGQNYYVATGGYLRQVARLPDFLGGPVFAGAWLENGDAFDEWSHAHWRSNGGVGVIMDTIVGPVLLGGDWSFDGRWRTYIGIGRIFR